jgi:hypothetical protein
MKVKLCPLKQITIKTDVSTTKTYLMECDEEVCAWYIEETKECAIKCIATRLESEIAVTQRQIPLNPDC